MEVPHTEWGEKGPQMLSNMQKIDSVQMGRETKDDTLSVQKINFANLNKRSGDVVAIDGKSATLRTYIRWNVFAAWG